MTFAWNLMSSEQKRSKLLSDVSPQWGETIVGRDVPFTFRPNQVNSSAVELRKWLLLGGGDNILSNFLLFGLSESKSMGWHIWHTWNLWDRKWLLVWGSILCNF